VSISSTLLVETNTVGGATKNFTPISSMVQFSLSQTNTPPNVIFNLDDSTENLQGYIANLTINSAVMSCLYERFWSLL